MPSEDELATALAGQTVRVMASPESSGASGITQAARLLAEQILPNRDGRILLIGGGPGALAVALARESPDGLLWLTDTNYLTLTHAQQTLASSGLAKARVLFDPVNLDGEVTRCDTVVLETPPDRQLARRWLAAAYSLLEPGGRLCLAGANDEGVRSAIADAAALFGSSVLLDYRGHARVASAVKSATSRDEPAWFHTPGIHPHTWREFDLNVGGMAFHLRSLPGIFAYDRLDAGTALLLAQLDVPREGQVLDMGCGFGIIGLAAARLGAARVDLVDVNLLAVAAARQNIAGNQIANARALPSDLFSAVAAERYDLIVTNPPFHAGKDVSYDVAHALIRQAGQALNAGGRLMLVANRFIPYDRLMREVFDKVDVLAATRRYHVLLGTRVMGDG